MVKLKKPIPWHQLKIRPEVLVLLVLLITAWVWLVSLFILVKALLEYYLLSPDPEITLRSFLDLSFR